MNAWLNWLTPALATLAVLLEGGYEAGLIRSDISALIVSILTAIAAFVVAVQQRKGESQPEQKKLPQPQQQQQPQQAQPKK